MRFLLLFFVLLKYGCFSDPQQGTDNNQTKAVLSKEASQKLYERQLFRSLGHAFDSLIEVNILENEIVQVPGAPLVGERHRSNFSEAEFEEYKDEREWYLVWARCFQFNQHLVAGNPTNLQIGSFIYNEIASSSKTVRDALQSCANGKPRLDAEINESLSLKGKQNKNIKGEVNAYNEMQSHLKENAKDAGTFQKCYKVGAGTDQTKDENIRIAMELAVACQCDFSISCQKINNHKKEEGYPYRGFPCTENKTNRIVNFDRTTDSFCPFEK